MGKLFQYFQRLSTQLIPFALGTVLVVISPLVWQHSPMMSKYSRNVGIGVSVISAIPILFSLFKVVDYYFEVTTEGHK